MANSRGFGFTLGAIAVANGGLLAGLFFVVWLAFALGFLVFGWLDSPLVVLVVLVVLKVIAEAFNALIDANAGPWEQAGEE